MAEQLTGKALLQKIKDLKESAPNATRRELARLCGYTTTNRKGETRINVAEFYEALLQARGLDLGSDKSQRRGREATFRVGVQKNGQILIGSAYTKNMGLQPGDEFDVKLGYKHIHLVKCSDDEAED
ncbi:MAG: AbrB family transcriptional regulator [Synechococcales cyanobacterium RM1_1_8]|nr:AbrB family transcriptional regulator [Synechococcales cyanobacterium RM1_1_8]